MNHYTVFSELTTGKLKDMLSGKLKYKNILAMVQAVNTKVIHKNVLKSHVEQLVSEIDYKNLGYKEAEDFKVSTTPGRNADQVNIIIMPACVYKLDEPFTLPQPPDERSKMLLALFCDEFERIKVRVFHAVWESFDTSMISLDAYKAMVFIKTCFRSQRIVFQEHLLKFPAFKKHPDAYINYMLAFFIIKVQVFFSKTFKDALAEDVKTEEQLFDELYRIEDRKSVV